MLAASRLRSLPALCTALLLSSVLAFSPRLMAQNSSSIEGVITDATGAAVPAANVTVKNTETGITRTVKTDAAGRYSVTALGNGSYAISAVAANFSTTSLTGVKLDISQTLKEDISLSVGGASDQVSVEAQALTTETETSSNGQTLDQKSVAELPLANRQFYNLVEVAPGVVPPAQASSMGFRGGMNINGAPETTNLFVVNGTWNVDMGTNQDSFRPSVDTIAEFKVLSGNYSAEYGRLQGGQILITTKQGSNKIHGSIYEFIRNGAIEAKPWSPTAQTVTPAFKQNTFGATLGGPILKDKAFVFVGYEGQRIRQQAVATNQVPTTFTAAGCLPGTVQAYDPLTGAPLPLVNTGACAGAPGYGYDITALSSWNNTSGQLGRLMTSLAYPTPNIASAASPTAACGSLTCLAAPGLDYSFSETRKETMDEINSRVDYKLNEHNSFYETYNYFHDPSFEPSNSLCATRNMPNFGCFTNQTSQLANIGWVHIFPGSNLINDARAGFMRLVQPRVQEDNTTIGSKWPGFANQLGTTAVPNNYGLPSITVSGNYTTTGGQTNLPQDRWDDHFQFIDTLTWSHKKHTYKAGVDVLWTNTTEYEVSNGRGAIAVNPVTAANANGSTHQGTTGDPIGDLLLGLPITSSVTPTAPNIYNYYRSVDLFLMDDWKITHNLTLNLGLRWELDPPVTEKNGAMATFSPSTPNQLYSGASNATVGYANAFGAITTASQTGNRSTYKGDYNNLAPRVGFAWQPFNNEKTVVKGAYGVYYTSPEMFNEFLSYSLGYPVRYAKSYSTGSVASGGALTFANPFPNDLPTPGSPYCVAGTAGCTSPNASVVGCASPCGLVPVVTSTEIDPKFATPYVQQWTLGVQRQLTRNTIFEALYFGNKGTKLSYGTAAVLNPNANANAHAVNQNYTMSTSASTGVTTYSALGAPALQALRVYPQWGAIGIHKTGFNSFYHSLQSRVQTSTKNGTSILVSYTYAKAEDELTSAQNPLNQHGDKGLSVFNVKHRLVVSPVVPLPFGKGQPFLNNGLGSAIFGGFQLSGIWQYFGGRPFPITDSSNQSSSAGGGDRPDVIAGQNPNGNDPLNGTSTHNKNEWFNIHAFAYNPPGTFGTTAPNALIGPGWDEVDLTFGRTFAIRDLAKVQFKVDAFNIANHPNLMNPSASFNGSPTYTYTPASTGKLTTATGFTSLAYPTTPGYCTTNTTTVTTGCTAPGSFGKITAANNMREIQASVHVSF